MTPTRFRTRSDDAELARRVGAGDPAAFAALDDRYRRPLNRYAGSLLRRSGHQAEDVVQDVLVKTHAELRKGRVPDALEPWLYRLTRNRAIDEVRRARWGEESLQDEAAQMRDERSEPEAVVIRRETVRRLVEDLADLPMRQRAALVGRELDGLSSEAVAARLGVSVPAAQMLASRARNSLVKARAAHDADHEDIREALLDAHERGVRASEHVHRHLKQCPACRAYAKELGRMSKRLGLLAPPLGFGPLAALVKLLGGGGKAAVGTAAAVAVVATGGVVVLATNVFSSGDPAPFQLKGIKPLVGHSVTTGQSVPTGTAVVTARVKLPAGKPPAGKRRSVALSCPPGMRIAGMQAPEQRGLPLGYGLASVASIGARRAVIAFDSRTLDKPAEGTVGILCRKPGARGSLKDNPRPLRPGETPATVCAPQSYIFKRPGRSRVWTESRGQPLAVVRRSASGTWTRIVNDSGVKGWIRTRDIARRC